jgi:hypothetical protein
MHGSIESALTNRVQKKNARLIQNYILWDQRRLNELIKRSFTRIGSYNQSYPLKKTQLNLVDVKFN